MYMIITYPVKTEEMPRNNWTLPWFLTNKMIDISLQNAQKCIDPLTFTSLAILYLHEILLHAVDVHAQMLYFVCNLKIFIRFWVADIFSKHFTFIRWHRNQFLRDLYPRPPPPPHKKKRKKKRSYSRNIHVKVYTSL